MSTKQVQQHSGFLRRLGQQVGRLALGLLQMGLGMAAFGLLFTHVEASTFVLGLVMLVAGGTYLAQIYVTSDSERRKLARSGAVSSIAAGALLLAAGGLGFRTLALFLGASWIVDGVRSLARLPLKRQSESRLTLMFDGTVSLIIGLAIAVQWPFAGAWTVYIAAGVRLMSAGWTAILGRHATTDAVTARDLENRHPDPHLGLPPSPQFQVLRRAWAARERHRNPLDLYWTATLLLTFFAIHISRMEAEWDLVGLISPAVAVVGDVIFALGIAYLFIVPPWLIWRFLSRPIERRLWRARTDLTGPNPSAADRFVRLWLRSRFALGLRLEQIGRSPAWAVRRGLQIGLLPAAVLVAVAPLLGISWYFNTETWATGLWEHWAAYRTDTWREQMTAAARSTATTRPFEINSAAVREGEDFSFIVIGDTGEGDASQHILRDQYLALGAREDVKFLVILSDVIYPQGAMKDYEPKFYLPFKGFNKPIYAIPGNHDWYDALEAFSANFFEPNAAKAAMQARLEADRRVSATTETTIDNLIQQAAWLRKEYGVQAGRQHGPYFEWQTPHFALIAVDTGILKNINTAQLAWLRETLERSRGKTIVVLAGHPLYAAGHPTTEPGHPYQAFHGLLREYNVSLLMAGDTHDFEVYREPYQTNGVTRDLLHVVNGGGGAYLSIGTALDWPAQPALPDSAIYPPRAALIEKLNHETPTWKRPLWWWIRTFHAWPASSEVLASAFASDRAPFYQSFVEIRVEPTAHRLRLLPYGPHGRLHLRDLEVRGNLMPPGATLDEAVELSIPMTTQAQAPR